MLDVHPAHHAATTWRDFFIHIATIVLGLLIAVALEQTVEYFHHRHLAHEAHEQLREERFTDERANQFNIYTSERHQRDLRRDLAIIHSVRRHEPLPPGPFIVGRFRYLYADDVWRRIQQSGTINYLHDDGLSGTRYRYDNQDLFVAREAESIQALLQAAAMLRSENDSPRISPKVNRDASEFDRKVVQAHGMLPESVVRTGYAVLEEHADLRQLTPAQLDELERAIKVALVDEDALLTYCFNIQRNLQNNPPR